MCVYICAHAYILTIHPYGLTLCSRVFSVNFLDQAAM